MLGFILHFIKIMPISDGMIEAITPLGIGLIAGGAQALIGGIGAIGARSRLNKLVGQEPKYEIPTKQLEAEQLGREIGTQGMARKAYESALQNIQQSAVQAGRTASMAGRGALLGSIGNVQAQQGKSVLDLATQDAIEMQKNQRFLYSALMAGAQYQDKKFANQWQSWMNKFQQERANLGASEQTAFGGIDTMASLAAMALNKKA